MPNGSPSSLKYLTLIVALAIVLSACSPAQTQPGQLAIKIVADNRETAIEMPPGSSVQTTLEKAGIQLNALDRVDPPGYTILSTTTTIQVTRVREEFEIEESIIPFERQTVRNESLPEGQTLLIQPGVNGKQQVTYRRVYENEKEVSRTVFKTSTISEARPEIMMVGVQAPFTSLPIPGKLAYLVAGNAWVMNGSTGNRKPVVTSGDLDGRVFALSPDGNWLLYTRKGPSGQEDTINTLWAVRTNDDTPKPYDLEVKNVINFANWVPGASLTIAYTTVEPRSTAPGWQANNDFHLLTFTSGGSVLRRKEIIATNSGGVYGWWGTSYFWSPDGQKLAYARPDTIGLVDVEKSLLTQLVEIIPLQTRSDWAWVPGVTWSADHKLIYTVIHVAVPGVSDNEASPRFDLAALAADGGPTISIVPNSGMFAYPATSPFIAGKRFQVAYLQAIFPDKSETSRYRLTIMDRDGSNRHAIFPPEGSNGLEPQQVYWAPETDQDNVLWLAALYQGNLWLINPETNQAQQVTGDGLLNKIDWK